MDQVPINGLNEELGREKMMIVNVRYVGMNVSVARVLCKGPAYDSAKNIFMGELEGLATRRKEFEKHYG